MKAIIVVSSVLVLLIALVIGAGIWLFLQFNPFKPNSRAFLVDNIRLMGRLEGRNALYGFVEVGNAGMPYSGKLGLSFRCGDTVIEIDHMTVEQLSQVAISGSSANHEKIVGGRWPGDAQRLRFCNSTVEVVVSEGVVLQAKANPRWGAGTSIREQPLLQIRTDRSSDWISIPFTDAEAVRLFGTPDRTTDSFIH